MRLNPAQLSLLRWAWERGGGFHEADAYYRHHFGDDRLKTLTKRGLLMRLNRYEYRITDAVHPELAERGML